MSSDQKLLYQASVAIRSGSVPANLAKVTIGPVFHARWITLATRILFLYMVTSNPSPELYRMAWFVVNIYCYLWFLAKRRCSAAYGPVIAFEAMRLIKQLPDEERQVVSVPFERGFMNWGHSEQLFLAGLACDDGDIRCQAVARILKARHNSQPKPLKAGSKRKASAVAASPVRKFEIPSPNYDATSFWNMIDWSKEQITPPPYLRGYTDEQLRQFENSPLTMTIPSNSQFLERFIKVSTDNGMKAGSAKRRDGRNKATIGGRKKRPQVETKRHFRH